MTSPQRSDTRARRPSLPRLSIAAAAAAVCFLVLTTLGGAHEDPPGKAPNKALYQATSKQVAPSLPAPTPTLSRSASRPEAQRVSWKGAHFATFYRVVFIRDSSHRLEIATTRTGLSVKALRSGKGLRTGRYRWFVRPGYGNPRLRKVSGRTFYGPITSRGVLLVRRPD